jgi:hypothetical protein
MMIVRGITKDTYNADGLGLLGGSSFTIQAMIPGIEGRTARSFEEDFVMTAIASVTIAIGLHRHYRNITAQLRQVYDLP